ncbi:hypothetical protein TRIUR3_14826 [Triticum urartu]|uniref:Uncharacterized protein n=1 Tax=Triticum urartu TaxID=4572 RepID=M7YUV6_TRIUA|nr:hypothetical protein TRIUR3_14826 [Triticum urartu]
MEVHNEVDGSGVPLAVLLKRELCNQKVEKPDILFGEASKSKKGEDFTLLVANCHRTPGEGPGDNAGGGDTISMFVDLSFLSIQIPHTATMKVSMNRGISTSSTKKRAQTMSYI